MKFAEYNEEYGRNEFANHFEKEAKQMVALQSLILGNELTSEEVVPAGGGKSITEFLDLPVNDKKETVLKKLFTASVIAAKSKGVLAFEIPDSPAAIASAIDEGLTQMKVAYKTATGELDSIEATDILIDRLVARVTAILDRALEKGVPVILDRICTAMVQAYPTTATVVPIIKNAERYITAGVKKAVAKGINTLARIAKPVVQSIIATAKRTAIKIKNFLMA